MKRKREREKNKSDVETGRLFVTDQGDVASHFREYGPQKKKGREQKQPRGVTCQSAHVLAIIESSKGIGSSGERPVPCRNLREDLL